MGRTKKACHRGAYCGCSHRFLLHPVHALGLDSETSITMASKNKPAVSGRTDSLCVWSRCFFCEYFVNKGPAGLTGSSAGNY